MNKTELNALNKQLAELPDIELLKSLLNYDPKTGLFTHKNSHAAIKAGDAAGNTCDRGYVRISIKNKMYLAHRLAWLYVYGSCPVQIDHIDQNKTNNVINNLRNVDNKTNGKNRKLGKNNKSGCYGVRWLDTRGKWRSGITNNNKAIDLGYFNDFFEAVCARKSAENKCGFHENHGIHHESCD